MDKTPMVVLPGHYKVSSNIEEKYGKIFLKALNANPLLLGGGDKKVDWDLEELRKNEHLKKLFIEELRRSIYGTVENKQARLSNDCMASVIAMVTNNPLDKYEFKEWVLKETGNNGSKGYKEIEAHRFLLTKGYLTGVGFISPQKRWLIEEELILAVFPIGLPAILIVGKEKEEYVNHAVYWDGSYIHDPDPDVKEKQELKDYDILVWWPISRLGGEPHCTTT